MNNDPVELDYEVVDLEERFRSVGLTDGGRCLTAVWTVRRGKARAVTAFPASASNRKIVLERFR